MLAFSAILGALAFAILSKRTRKPTSASLPRITFTNKPDTQENRGKPAFETPIAKAEVWNNRIWLARKIFLRTAVLALLMLYLLKSTGSEPFLEWYHDFDAFFTPL